MSTLDTATPELKFAVGDLVGPASYSSSITLDVSADMTYVLFVELALEVPGTVPPHEIRIQTNPQQAGNTAFGIASIEVDRIVYSRTTVGSASTGLPIGIPVAKFAAATTTGSAHTHPMDHDHPSVTTGAPIAGGDGVGAAAAQPATSTHTHGVDVAAFTGSTGSSTHAHDRSFEYEHTHDVSKTAQNATVSEVTGTTDLSGTTWRYLAVGF